MTKKNNNDKNKDDFDIVAFRNFVADMFPSKHSKARAKATQRFASKRRIIEDDDDDDEEKEEETLYDTEEDSEDIDEDSDDSEDSDYETETDSCESDSCSSSSSSSSSSCSSTDKKKKKKQAINVFFKVRDKKKNKKEKEIIIVPPTSIYDISNISQTIQLLQEKDDGSPLIKDLLHNCEKRLQYELKLESQRHKATTKMNLKTYKKLNKDKTLYDKSYFKKLDPAEQKRVNEHVAEINTFMQPVKPYRFMVIQSNIPLPFKAAALSKINAIQHMDPGSSEYYKVKSWIDAFMKIPFNIVNELPISVESGVNQCHEFMLNAKTILDEAVYGLNDAKMQIMQMLGQFITNPKSIGTSIAIHGPPGTGKTSLVREGISKILHRPFAFIALGGATDSNVFEGHSYTYEGSTWGKIVQILIDSKCMNPIIYFDELDKVSETPRGEEIIGILTHLTDSTQNSQFHDKYFAEFSFDLSKCLFIFSYNDESKINPILRDRMYRIQTGGYSNRQKNVIVQKYLLPKIREQVKFNEGDIIISNEIVSYIMENVHLCENEKGVRNLKRCLEIIHTKLNLFRLMKTDENIFEEEMSICSKIEFPIEITRSIADRLLKNNKENISALYSMYM
jgi:ATP-dependent Lon protease